MPVSPFIRKLWDRKPFKNVSIITLNSVYGKFMRRAEEEGVSREKVHNAFDAVDPNLDYDSLIEELEEPEYIGVPYEYREEWYETATLTELEKEAAALGYDIVKSGRHARLESADSRLSEMKERVNELKSRLEKERRRREIAETEYERRKEELDKYSEELAEWSHKLARRQFGLATPSPAVEKPTKLVKIKFTSEVSKFKGTDGVMYGPFKSGELADVPEANANFYVEKKFAEVFKPPKPPFVPDREKEQLWLGFKSYLEGVLGIIAEEHKKAFNTVVSEAKNKEEAKSKLSELVKRIEKAEKVRVKAPPVPPKVRRIPWHRKSVKAVLEGHPIKRMGYVKAQIIDVHTRKVTGEHESFNVDLVARAEWKPTDFELKGHPTLDFTCKETLLKGKRLIRCVAELDGQFTERYYIPKF